MSEATPAKMNKAERLALASAVAGQVRQQAQRPRRVVLVDKEGKPKGETTNVEVAKSLLRRTEIEFSVQEDKKSPLKKCAWCGGPFVREKKKTGGVRIHCDKCRRAFRECQKCKVPVSAAAGSHAKRKNRLPLCKNCKPAPVWLLETARKRSTEAAKRAASEAVCKTCGVPLPIPKTSGVASQLRKKRPDGRRCRSCAQRVPRSSSPSPTPPPPRPTPPSRSTPPPTTA
jgi:hypothetical protein